jgi:hypothetical protein
MMAGDMMMRCEEKRLHKVDGKKEWRWIDVGVGDLSLDGDKAVRCTHCHGEVKLRKQKGVKGAPDHLEHRLRQDSENCQGGHYFLGSHRPSAKPVV